MKKTKASFGFNAPFCSLLLCIFLFGSSGLYTRFSDASVFANIFFRFLFAMPFYFIMVNSFQFKKVHVAHFQIKFVEICILLLLGGLYAANNLFYFNAIEYIPLGYGLLINLSTPLVILPLSLLFYRELPPKLFYVGLIVAFVGLYFVLGNISLTSLSQEKYGLMLASGATLSFGLYLFILAHCKIKFNVYKTMFFITIGAVITAGIVGNIKNVSLLPPDFRSWVIVICFAITAQILGQVSLTYSVRNLPINVVSTTLLATPLVGSFLGWVIFDEILTWKQSLGMLICLTGIYLIKNVYERLERQHDHIIKPDRV